MIELSRTIIRRLPGGAVVEIGPEGIVLRRYKGRRRLAVGWDQVASLAGPNRPVMRLCEQCDGRRVLAELGVQES